MSFLLRDFFESLIIIFLGGTFILIDVLFSVKKSHFEKIKSLDSTRFVFRIVALFLFALAATLTGEHIAGEYLHHFPWRFRFLENAAVLCAATFLMTLVVLFFGIIIPRFLGEFHSTWKPILFLENCSLRLTTWISPFVLWLDSLAARLFTLFGLSLYENHAASDQEVIQLMDEGLHSGVFNASEKEMVEGVLELDEQTAASLMTPRTHLVCLNLEDEEEKNWRRITASGHSEFPVFQGEHDNIVGIVSIKSLWANLSLAGSAALSDLITPPLYVFSNMTASKIIEEFRVKKRHTALVVNEFGVVEGIITLKDVIESILGMLPEREVRGHYPEIKKQSDGSWLVDAMLHYEEASEQLGLPSQPKDEESRYQTIGGFFIHHLGHIPQTGESLSIENFQLKIFSMNHQRIDKILVTLENSSLV